MIALIKKHMGGSYDTRECSLSCKWVYIIKYKFDEVIERYQARLVAK